MISVAAELLEASRKLTVEQRRELAQAIWESIEEQGWSPSRQAMDEVRRRRAEYLAAPETAVTSEMMWAQIDELKSA